MAKAHTSGFRDGSWKDSGKHFLKMLAKPAVILYFSLVLTLPLWMRPLLHLLLWTYLYIPSGWHLWLLATLAGSFFIWTLFRFVIVSIRSAPLRRAKTDARRSGDLESYKKANDEMRETISGKQLNLLFLGACSKLLLIPLAVVIVLWSGLKDPMALRKDHGKLRYTTPQENLYFVLRNIDHLEIR